MISELMFSAEFLTNFRFYDAIFWLKGWDSSECMRDRGISPSSDYILSIELMSMKEKWKF